MEEEVEEQQQEGGKKTKEIKKKKKKQKAEKRAAKIGRQEVGEGICSSRANYVNENGERIASVQ